MLRIPLPGEDAALLLAPRWANLGGPFQTGLLAGLFLVPLVLVICLYRYELRLVRGWTAAGLLSLRLLVLLLLCCLIGLQPVVARIEVEEDKGKIIVAVDRSASMDVADPQRDKEERRRLARPFKLPEETLEELTRTETIRQVLAKDGLDLLAALAARHDVELCGFHQEIWQSKGLEEVFRSPSGKNGTDLALPLARALDQAGKGKVRGIVLLTDGRHNAGPDPLSLARDLGARRVPIYPLALGGKKPPPDICLVEVKAPSQVFADVDVPFVANIKVSGLPAQDLIVELWRLGKAGPPEQSQTIKHDGSDRFYQAHFSVPLEEAGSHAFEVKVRPGDPAAQEISRANNSLPAMVRVASDKARVLLIDGEARWEYYYLSKALLRDKALTADRVVFSQPRLGLVPEAALEKAGNPRLKLPAAAASDKRDPLFAYDCIILGDVSPQQLPLGDRRRLERFVAGRGGTLILQAGKRFMPLSFLAQPADDDPLVKLLPIKRLEIVKPLAGFSLNLTAEGALASFMQVETTLEANRRRWQDLPRHFWGVGGQPRPGAIVLADATAQGQALRKATGKNPGLIVEQNYGLGRVLYLGIESTWRWRYQVGDLYHHRFWGQLVRWAASGKLLPAGNQHVRYGSREPVYRQGQAVDIAVRLAEDVPLLPSGARAQVRLIPLDGKKQSGLVPLTPGEYQPSWLTGQVRDLPPGTYRIGLDIPKLESWLKGIGQATFTVLPPGTGELADLSTNWPLLQNLASQSQGQVLVPETAHRLVDLLARQTARHLDRQETRPWQDQPAVWFTLGILLTLLGLEWVIRKMAGLP